MSLWILKKIFSFVEAMTVEEKHEASRVILITADTNTPSTKSNVKINLTDLITYF